MMRCTWEGGLAYREGGVPRGLQIVWMPALRWAAAPEILHTYIAEDTLNN